MGRELRRVPLDFDHPVGEIWPGFLNEHYQKSHACPACIGQHGSTGLSPMGRQLHDAWYGYNDFKPEQRDSTPFTPAHPSVWAFAERNVSHSPKFYLKPQQRTVIWSSLEDWGYELEDVPVTFEYRQQCVYREALRLCDLFNQQWSHHLNQMDVDALVDHGRLYDFTHTFTPGKGWEPKNPPYHPTAEEVNSWSLSSFGHDSINQWCVVKALCDRLEYDHLCATCNGEAILWDSEEDRLAYENWQSTAPPEGKGYQLWETVTEGSPKSPVFATAHELATWLSTPGNLGKNDVTKDNTYDQWMAFIEGPGWAPSFIGTVGSGMKDGVAAIVELEESKDADNEC